jgi:hypothetical protein
VHQVCRRYAQKSDCDPIPRGCAPFRLSSEAHESVGKNCRNQASLIDGLQPSCDSRGITRAKEKHMKLLMSEGGEIACERHAPYAGSDSRVWGRWRAMRTSERVDFQAEVGRQPSCETCDALARRHAEGAHATRQSDECALCAGSAG